MKNNEKGTYGYDTEFFKKHNIGITELKDSGNARVLIIPAYQGRVMTSSSAGDEGMSYGWINYKLIESGTKSNQFNPYGGEERLWLGPEGGPFSIYFKKGTEQVFANWLVPPELDTEPFETVNKSDSEAEFAKTFSLVNASGTPLNIRIQRKVRLLARNKIAQSLGVSIDPSLSAVGYESENTLVNNGNNAWTKETGALSIWMLAMFNPSEQGVVVIPFQRGDEKQKGKIVTDDYFGNVPAERLIRSDGILYFRTDGKFRSKIGLSPERALPLCGSYDPVNRVLTLLSFSLPEKPSLYVNSKWGKQDDPFRGDVVNSYNDGPVDDGSIMGPFYEIESSSPAAFLKPGESITHMQRIFHISGDASALDAITGILFNISTDSIAGVFR